MIKQLRLFPVFLSEDKPYVLERLGRVLGRRAKRMTVVEGWKTELATIAVVKEKKARQPYLSVEVQHYGATYYRVFYEKRYAARCARSTFMWYLSRGVSQ